MKTLITVLALIGVVLIATPAEAQILKKIKTKAQQKKEQKGNEIINKSFDELEKTVEGDNTKKDKQEKKNKNTEDETVAAEDIKAPRSEQEEIKIWTERYDFVAGKQIIFFDDFEDEDLGEIPRQWKYINGETEAVKITNYGMAMKFNNKTAPNFEEDYELPDAYTIEFDIWFMAPPYNGSYG